MPVIANIVAITRAAGAMEIYADAFTGTKSHRLSTVYRIIPGDVSRGARFNSIKNYIAWKKVEIRQKKYSETAFVGIIVLRSNYRCPCRREEEKPEKRYLGERNDTAIRRKRH